MAFYRLAFLGTLSVYLAGAALAGPAAADPPAAGPPAADATSVDAAKQHFDRGQMLYLRGQYDEAAVEFLAAHDAKPFPAFLYNAAVAYERARNYDKALALYKQYLAAAGPQAKDHDAVEKRIAALNQAVASTPRETVTQATGAAGGASQPSEVVIHRQAQPSAAAQAAVAALPAPEVKGIVLIESDPPGATVWLDDKQGAPLGTTPWEGSVDKGHHTVIIEAQGYKPEKKDVEPSSDRMIDLYFALAKEHFLGWVEVTGNVAGADVYDGSKDAGSLGKTPFTGFLKPGKHHLVVSKPGYEDTAQDVTVVSGEAAQVQYTLNPWSYGLLEVSGSDGDAGDRVYLDGELACSIPCKQQVPPGPHRVTVTRPDMKSLNADVVVRQGGESSLQVHMQPRASRWDALVSFVAAGAMAGGGFYLGRLAHENETALQTDLGGYNPPLASNDPRLTHGMYEAIGADALYGVAGLTAVLGVYYLFRDAGPASTGQLTQRDVAAAPALSAFAGPGIVGLSAAGSF